MAARSLGLSLRRFCGWTAASWTEYEHDDAGRTVRSVTRCEAEWDDGQRLWMLALAHYEATLCRKCGHDLAESTSTGWEWKSNDPVECQACSALGRADRAWSEKTRNDARAIPAEAMIHTVRKVPRRTPSQHREAKQARQARG